MRKIKGKILLLSLVCSVFLFSCSLEEKEDEARSWILANQANYPSFKATSNKLSYVTSSIKFNFLTHNGNFAQVVNQQEINFTFNASFNFETSALSYSLTDISKGDKNSSDFTLCQEAVKADITAAYYVVSSCAALYESTNK